MDETRQVYLNRINSVLDFIEKNLEADLSLKSIAKLAHYSPYHFHRVFLTVVEERLNEFINRKRIERIASILLVEPEVSLKNLAYQYGFNSDSSFSRAFRKYYGISPTKFKSEGKELLSKIGIEPFSTEKYICAIDKLKQWSNMNAQITVKELPALKLASISHIGDFDKMGAMFQKLMTWGQQKGVLPSIGFKALSIYHDNPNVTQTSKVRFSAAITINQSIDQEGEIRPRTLPKGIYAIGRFEIKSEAIAKAWKSMCVWVIENGLTFRDGDYFEVYHNDHQIHPERKFLLDICIPLESSAKLSLGEAIKVNFSSSKKLDGHLLDYHQLIQYMKELRAFFHKEYGAYFKLGKVYQGNPNFSYLSLTTAALKKLKLKFVIVLDHQQLSFSICLSGQNKSIRRKYWQLFKGSDWNPYHLVESIDNSLFILDHTIVATPDFNNKTALTEQIERESLKFINELTRILEP